MSIVKERPIPREIWDQYGAPWPGMAAFLKLLTGAETAYGTFEGLGVYQKTWEETKEMLPYIPGGKVLDLGCGQGKTFSETLERTGASFLLGVDISSSMLAGARKRAEKRTTKGAKVELVQMDIGVPWPIEGKFNLILSHITLGWITPSERANVFAQIPDYLDNEGVALLSFRTDGWSNQRVKQHIPEELKRSVRACLGAIFGAKKHTDRVEELLETGQIDAVRPSREEIFALIGSNRLEVIGERGTFWPDDPEGPAGLALLLRKKGN